MKIPFLLGLLAAPVSLASAQSDDAEAAYKRRDVAALTRMAEAGDLVAQYNLGRMYWLGFDVTEDYAAAVSWFRKAADQGSAAAQSSLGTMYRKGLGVTQDYAAAVSWFRKAADQGYAVAQNNLGFMYREGLGVTRNYEAALSWYRKAADQESAEKEVRAVARRHIQYLESEINPRPSPKYDYKNVYYKGYKLIGTRDPVVNSCLDLIIKQYNISYTNKYGKLIVKKQLTFIQVNGPSRTSLRNGSPFRVQNYTVIYMMAGLQESDVVYCESKNGIAYGLENSLQD